MGDDVTREHRGRRGVPTDDLASLLWTFATRYVPNADAMIVQDRDGGMRITPGTVVASGTAVVLTRRRLAEFMHNTATSSDCLREWDNALVLAVAIWSMR
ncbi:hypothetical protein AB0M43_34740 [Longispora sp. NPDC051575]|uniref:hypothetical protein n=1 Tax=Longispora sp. NPDC051575 TaxID=3154943 RepID=UPI00342CE922